GDGVYFAVKINVPYSGTFSAKMTYYQYDNTTGNTKAENTEGDVYLLKSTVTDVTKATAEDKVADIATAVAYGKPDSDGVGVKETSAKDITLSAGEYILVFEQTQRRGGSSGQRMRPSVLTLTSGALADGESYATVPMYICEASATDAELEVGENTELTVSGWMNDGTAFDENSENVTFSTDSENISITGNTVTANSAGNAVVTASVTSGGKTIAKDIAITVARPVGETPYQLEYHFTQVDEFINADKYCYQDGNNSYMIPDNATFAGTYGMWAFYGQDGISNWGENNSKAFQYRPSYSEIRTMQAGDYFAVKINVPYGGTYNATYSHRTRVQDYILKVSVYILAGDATLENIADDIANKKTVTIANGLVCSGPELANEVVAEDPVEIKNLSAGEHILLFYVDECEKNAGSESRIRPASLTLTSGELATDEEYAIVPMYINEAKANDAELEVGENTELTVSGWFNDRTSFNETSVTFSSESENISIDGNTVTANATGEATVTATVTSGEKSLSKDIDIAVVPTAQEKADAAFITDDNKEENISYTASDLKGLTIDGDVINGVPNSDGSYNLKAPEKNKAGYEFVYWAKGNVAKKRILLFQTNELKNYVPDESGVTYLIPVYEDMLPTSAEYYNANGQLIPDAKDSDRPYMAGYGTASGWKQYGETNIRVAEYDNKTQPDDVTVSVEKGTGGGTVPYGDPVTCTADESNGTFRWWQKDVNGAPEIVSVDKSYTFLAYEDCTVTAVYGDSAVTVTNPVKII
ncbi:MAG: Ig-like domain-containing protein, partial [Clostridia bacterium]|nr:Ig-like domain-containing protein [Clostridia bacterium]